VSARRQRRDEYTTRFDTAQIAHDAAQTDEDAEACPGSCNDIWINAERAAFNETARAKAEHRPPRPGLLDHQVPMIAAAPMWCRPCQEHITGVIAAFPDQCEPLTPGPLNTPRDIGTNRPGGAGVNPPTLSPAWDTADEIIRWAVNTEDTLRARSGDAGFGQRPWRTLTGAVAYLTGHATALMSCPDAVAIGFDALKLGRRLTQVTGTDRLVHRLPGTCMVCDRRALQRLDGDDLVKCRACGACWDLERYEFLARAYAHAVTSR
jgi:hypothetical protein